MLNSARNTNGDVELRGDNLIAIPEILVHNACKRNAIWAYLSCLTDLQRVIGVTGINGRSGSADSCKCIHEHVKRALL